jgi:hypothetical protein
MSGKAGPVAYQREGRVGIVRMNGRHGNAIN